MESVALTFLSAGVFVLTGMIAWGFNRYVATTDTSIKKLDNKIDRLSDSVDEKDLRFRSDAGKAIRRVQNEARTEAGRLWDKVDDTGKRLVVVETKCNINHPNKGG